MNKKLIEKWFPTISHFLYDFDDRVQVQPVFIGIILFLGTGLAFATLYRIRPMERPYIMMFFWIVIVWCIYRVCAALIEMWQNKKDKKAFFDGRKKIGIVVFLSIILTIISGLIYLPYIS
ncbi:MAG: hypothetical protein Q8P11_01305 [bacterium]|nr:hypothetical protein [bacterium]